VLRSLTRVAARAQAVHIETGNVVQGIVGGHPVHASSRLAVVVASVAALGASLGLSHTARAGATVNVVVLMEHGQGTASMAQPYLNKFIALAAQPPNNFDPASTGKYFTDRLLAEAYIKSDSPRYGIFSLPAFLELRRAYNMDVLGEAKINAGGEQYFIVSMKQGSLADCKGKTLATDHLQIPSDEKFIEKVVASGAFTKADFSIVQTKRFGQAGNDVINGNAECALINDAQLANGQKSNAALKAVWSSAKLPAMAVVAFPSAPPAEKATFQGSLPNLCAGAAAAQVCTPIGVLSINSNAAQFQAIIAKYP
jgi:hypothetical protein